MYDPEQFYDYWLTIISTFPSSNSINYSYEAILEALFTFIYMYIYILHGNQEILWFLKNYYNSNGYFVTIVFKIFHSL